jgi:hypothetical protein
MWEYFNYDEYTLEQYQKIKNKKNYYLVVFACGHKRYVRIKGYDWKAHKKEILEIISQYTCEECKIKKAREKYKKEEQRIQNISFTNDMLNIYKVKIYYGYLPVKDKSEESKQHAINVIKKWYKTKDKKIYEKFKYITAETKDKAIKKIKEYCHFWDGVEHYYEYVVSYEEPIQLNIKTKFLPDESKDNTFCFIANGKKYKVDYHSWDFFSVTNEKDEKEDLEEDFPFCFFPVLAKSEDYALFDLGDGYQMVWGEVAYSDTLKVAIFNKKNNYFLGWNSKQDNIKYYLKYMKQNY